MRILSVTAALLALALSSNALSFPYIYANYFTKEKLRWG